MAVSRILWPAPARGLRRGDRLTRLWVVLLLLVLSASGALIAISTVRTRAHTANHASLVLAQLGDALDIEYLYSISAIGHGQVPASAANGIAQARARVHPLLADLRHTDDPTQSAPVVAAVSAYETALDTALPQLAAAQGTQAAAIAGQGVSPAFARVQTALAAAAIQARADAATAMTLEQWGEVGTVIALVLVVAGLLLVTARAQRRATRVSAEQAVLRRSEEHFRALIELGADMITVLDAEGRLRYVSPAAEPFFGAADTSVLGVDAFSFLDPEAQAPVRAQFAAVCATPGIHPLGESCVRDREGTAHTLQSTANNLLHHPTICGVVVTARDITAERQAEAARHAAEEDLAQATAATHLRDSLLDQVRSAVVAVDTSAAISYWNPYCEQMYGWTAAEAMGHRISDLLIPPSHRHMAAEIDAGMIAVGHWEGELPAQHKAGTIFPTWLSVAARTSSSGEWLGATGVAHDLTAQKQAEAALRASEERFRGLFENATLGLYRATPDGVLLLANPALVALLGHTDFAALVACAAQGGCTLRHKARETSAADLPAAGRVTGDEGTWQRHDGTPLVVRESGWAVHDAAGNLLYYEGMVEDITAQQELGTRLEQAERLSALGELAAGMAHEINNPIAALSATAQLLLHDDLPAPLRADLQRMHREADRAGEIVRSLLRFARQREIVLEPLSLADVLDDTLALLGDRLQRHHVRVVRRDADCPLVAGDRDQLLQVVLNILGNAIDALRPQGGGTLTLTLVPEPAGATLTIADDGPGIAPTVLARIFDPFVTTKPPGEGTGLGLSIAQRIVAAHDGTLRVESQPGSGACFQLSLPAATAASAESVDGGQVLLVASEPDVIFLADALRMLGYSPCFAPPAEDVPLVAALFEPARAGTAPQELRARRPQLRLIALAGGEQPAMYDALLPPTYSLEDLREVLEGQAA